MAKDKKLTNKEPVVNKTDEKKKITLEVDLPDNGDLIVCEVCGHKNSKNAGMCAMCSNYLFN